MVSQVNTSLPRDKRRHNAILKGGLVESLEGQVYPREREHDVLSVLDEVGAELPSLEDRLYGKFQNPTSKFVRDLLEQSRWAVRADAAYRRLALRLLRESSYDVFAVYFGGADVMGHRFWRYRYPAEYAHPPSEQEVADYGRIAPRYYEYLDDVVGELIDAAGKEVNVIVVGDHGMGVMNRSRTFEPPMLRGHMLSGGHPRAPTALLIAAGPNIAAPVGRADVTTLQRSDLHRLGSVIDVTPTLLALAGEPADRSMTGRVLEAVIDDGFLDHHPVTFVDGYTGEGWAQQRLADVPGDVDVDERLKQLRALGYID
jgi:hypothetical protein